jgi:hypothetical protein
MNSRIEQLTKGLLSLAVILMFAAALVADQARAHLPEGTQQATEIAAKAPSGLLFEAATLQKISAIPTFLSSAFNLSSEIDLCTDLLNSGGHADRSKALPLR